MGERGTWITPAQWARFDAAVAEGNSVRIATDRAGISYNSGRKRIDRMRAAGVTINLGNTVKPIPKGWTQLSDRAKRAWDDFEYFRLVYMGHPSVPWMTDFATQVVEALGSSHKEYMIVNCPPGVGKTTELHDIAAWITVRNRAIRGAIISKNATNGARMMMRLRRTLERATPARARDEEVKNGLAVHAEACLAVDYGLFKPAVNADVWRADQFVVVQSDDTPIDEKEPTWSSYGMKSDVLSNRYDIMLIDDADDHSTIRTVDAAETHRAKYDDEIENRLEPRGVLFLVQQRFGSADLSAYNLSKKVALDPETLDDMTEDEQEAALREQPGMYTHIKYRAHDETRCQGKDTHRFDSPPWPTGCLLDPRRLPWREINTLRNTKPRSFAIQYQQEDADPETVLVKKAWVYGNLRRVRCTGRGMDGMYEADGRTVNKTSRPGTSRPAEVSAACRGRR